MRSRQHPQSSLTGNELSLHGWLIFDERGDMRIVRKEAGLRPGERAMKLLVSVPRSVFRTPTLRAEIAIPKGDAPDQIVAKTQTLADQLSAGLGLTITVVAPEDQS